MNRHLILFAIVFFLNTSFSTAQPIPTERLNTTDGLSNNRVHHIFQDSYGLLWIGTEYGLNLYDGYDFKIFKNDPGNPESINSNIIWWIVEDAKKNLWIGTGEGVSKYLRAENKFKNYDLYGDYYSTAITYIDSKGNIWAGVETENVLKYNKENDSWDEQEYVLIDSSRKYNNPRIVLEITEDINKKLWIASIRHGLMWYDENKKVFKQSEVMNKSEASDFTSYENFITSLYSDSTGILWTTTRNGIYKYNPALKKLKTIKKYTIDKLNEWNAYNCITQDEKGNVLIANTFNGFLKFDGISDDFNRIEISGQNYSRDGRSDIVLTYIFCDRTGILWMGTMTKGVIKYDPNKKLFAHYKHNEKNKNSVSNSQIYSLLESTVHPGKIYVGTRGGGLNLFDPGTSSFSTIPFDVFEDQYGGSVRSILEEEDGSLWLGTWGDGLLKMDPQRKVVRRFCPDSTNIDCLSDARVRIIRKDSSGNLWIGTSGGLNYMDMKAKTITRFNREYLSYSQELIDLIKNKISLNLEKAKIIKVGNSENLTAKFKIEKSGNFLVVSAGEGNERSDPSMWDYGWVEDSNQKIIWSSESIDSTYHIGGASKNRVKIETLQLNPGKYSLKYKSDDSHCFGSWNKDPPVEPEFWGIRIFKIDDQSELDRIQIYLTEIRKKLLIRGRYIRALHLSKNNIVWIGTDQYGLHKINKDENNVKTYLLNNEDQNSLSDISINDIYEDNKGILWLATDRGLTEFDPVKETFTNFTEEDGLPSNFISSILSGDNKELWLSTLNGISKMIKDENTGKVTFANFGMEDGLGGMNFMSLVALKTNDGKYFFGGGHGLNEFTLKSSISTPPKLILTDLQISKKSVLSMKANILQEKPIYDLKNLSLSYSQNDLSFEFAALHFSDPKKNKYAHKLEGYEDDWIYDNRRIATYTNLDPGEYTFKFKGSNRDGYGMTIVNQYP
jgi:ligand-binding sensor domain-containing protein